MLKSDFPLGNLVFAHYCHVGDVFGVGKTNLLFHLGTVGINLGRDARLTKLLYQRKAMSAFAIAEIAEHHFCGGDCVGGIEIQCVEHIENAVGTEGDSGQ